MTIQIENKKGRAPLPFLFSIRKKNGAMSMFVVEPQYINRKETVSSPTIRFTAIGTCVIMKWKTERSYKEEITMLHFGKRLKELRKSAKLTQADLAERLMVSVQTISKWETGFSQT